MYRCPFWDRQRGGWVDAADLRLGSQVTDLNNKPVTVTKVTSHTSSKLMNDLTIADIHTYYVIAGNTPVLVHNVGEACDIPLGGGFPDRALPRDKNGVPVPDVNVPHTQLGTKTGRNGSYPQAREFDENGNPVRDIDFTDHGRPADHGNPHQHDYLDNPTGGTPQRGPAVPLEWP